MSRYDDALIESNVPGSTVKAWDMPSLIFARAKSLKESDKLQIEPGVKPHEESGANTKGKSKQKSTPAARQVSYDAENHKTPSTRYSTENVTPDDLQAQIDAITAKTDNTTKEEFDPEIAHQLKAQANEKSILASVAQMQADMQASQTRDHRRPLSRHTKHEWHNCERK
jgi:hypothetical protein